MMTRMTNECSFPTSFKMEGGIRKRWKKYLNEKRRAARGLASVIHEGIETFLEKEGF